ncbi:MAG TPA: class E sortase [Baekduia sp.]|uniref:class E sortase n=1 Tax=Baekduia sp. TaxID=2600305 RepID=UPI002D7702C0|nr:class E sortase [Baekduia sp.]HET6505844.1 class E sortase [Baekduia sp.]
MTWDVAHAEWAGGGPGYALVRLTGAARGPGPFAPPTLLVADGARWARIAPEPGTRAITGGGAPFVVDFALPLHLAIEDGADWWLEPGPRLAVADPAPDPRIDRIAARVAELAGEIAALRARLDAVAVAVPPDGGTPPDAPAPAGTAPVPVPPRRHRLRPRRPGLPALLVAAGALAVGDAVATVVWQEPVSALWAARQQDALEGDLHRLDAAYASPAASAAAAAAASGTATPQNDSSQTAPPPSPAARMRALAHTLETTTKSGRPLGELHIPHLDDHYVIVAGTGASSLRKGPGHYDGTALPGEPGTVGIAGHRTTYGAPFRHLDALRRGDPITITMPYGTFTYKVEGTRIVTPSDVSALRAVGRQRLALTACHPLYSAKQRIVVTAALVRATPRGAAAGGAARARPA